jgi:hypothetical protein
VQSKSLGSVFKTPVDVAKAMYQNIAAIGDIMNNSEAYQAALRSGGIQSEIFGLEDVLGKNNVWKLNKESGNFLGKTWNGELGPREVMSQLYQSLAHSLEVIKSPLEYGAHVSDTMARVAEFKRAGGVEGDLAKQFEAGFKARNVTLDYMRSGAIVKNYSALVPFVNIGIQGMDRMARGWAEDKIGFTARAAAALTIPTMLNWALNRHDSRYQDAPNWEKDLYWIIPTDKWEQSDNVADVMSRPQDLRRQRPDGKWEVNNGTTLRIAKPFELGLIFASAPERFLNRFIDENPRAGAELISTMLHGVVPNVIPTAITPMFEQATNHVFFTNRPIISSHAEGLLPEYQYNEYTSEVAKQLGKVIGYVPGLRDLGPKDAKLASPQVIDNYIREWSGTLGQYVLQGVGALEQKAGIVKKPEGPVSVLADYPIIKAFIVRHPSAQLQPIQDFYDDYQKATIVNNTMNDLMKKGDIEGAMKVQAKNQADLTRLTSIKTALATMSKSLQTINEAPTISPNDKRQLMDAIYYRMSAVAKEGNRAIDARRKQLNAIK